MNKDLQDIDDLFRSALEKNYEIPSASVKESLFAHLDKQDAGIYKKRSLVWKRAAILLFFVLAGFVLYESGLIRPAGYSFKKFITQKSVTRSPDQPAEVDPVSIKDKKQVYKSDQEKNKQLTGQIKSTSHHENYTVFPGLFQKTGNTHENETQKIDNYLLAEKNIMIIPTQKINLGKMEEPSLNNLQFPMTSQIKIVNSIDPPLKNIRANNSEPTRIHHVSPYWTITGLVTYDRVNYKLDSDQPNAITSIQHREVHEPSFSVGLLATRQANEKWAWQTGLVYSRTAIGINPQKIYALQDPAGDIAYKYISSSGYTYIKPGFGAPPLFGDSILSTEAKHSLDEISIPIVIKYTIGKNRFLLLPGAGIEANFITSSKLEIEIEDAANHETVFINKLSGTKSFYWSLVADAELRYNINKKISFSVRPVFRYAISAITENNVVETFPYSFGTGLGMTYKF